LLGKKPPIDKVNTLIGNGTHIEGKVTSNCSIRVDGQISGEIKAEGHVFIGKTGVIVGDIHSNSLTIEGQVEGNVFIKDGLQLMKGSQLTGDTHAESIEIEQGASFNGKSHMQSKNNTSKNITKEKTKEAV
jgi:cytoskeletal protein CcmA (bactofilin family)